MSERGNIWRRALVGLSVLGASGAHAACNDLPFGLTQPAMERFLIAPVSLFDGVSRDADGIASKVRLLATTDPAPVLERLTQLLGPATDLQRRGIGTGLGQAAALCLAKAPDTARRFRGTVQRLPFRSVVAAFTTAFVDDLPAIGADAPWRPAPEPDHHQPLFGSLTAGPANPFAQPLAPRPPIAPLPSIGPVRPAR